MDYKQQLKTNKHMKAIENLIGKKVIVRSYGAGVFFGTLNEAEPTEDKWTVDKMMQMQMNNHSLKAESVLPVLLKCIGNYSSNPFSFSTISCFLNPIAFIPFAFANSISSL